MANALKAALCLHSPPHLPLKFPFHISPLMPSPSEPDEPPNSGAYATCYKLFSCHHDSLSQLDFMADFREETNSWPPGRFVTSFFRPSDPEEELIVALFGEVLDEDAGTGLGVKGGSALKCTGVNLSQLHHQFSLR